MFFSSDIAIMNDDVSIEDIRYEEFISGVFHYRKAREDLEARTKKLSEVMANFGDVVPSKDFERLDAQFKVLTKASQSFENLFILKLILKFFGSSSPLRASIKIPDSSSNSNIALA